MYGGVGRSGHHRQHVGNHWQDWEETSPNGHQYRNPLTREVRDLSGSEYWHARKANNQTEMDKVDMKDHFIGNCANISAYASDPEQKPKRPVKKKSAFEQVNLADRHYQRLENLSIQLDEELEAGEISMEDWVYARKQLDKRLDAGWLRLCKARGWNPVERDEEIYSLCVAEMAQKHKQKKAQKDVDSSECSGLGFVQDVAAGLSEENIFRPMLEKLLTATAKLSKILEIIKN